MDFFISTIHLIVLKAESADPLERNPYPKIINTKENYLNIEDYIDDLKNHPRDPSINHEWTKHSEKFEKRISKVKPGQSLYEGFRDAYKRQYLGFPSMAVKENHGGTHIHPRINRVISAREMARLQTFPDNFIFEGSKESVRKQIGMAVPVNGARIIFEAILKTFENISYSTIDTNLEDI